MRTAQQLFDQVVSHLRTQGKPCYSSVSGGCAYRGQNGLKCAIGALIPDEAYLPRMEGLDAGGILQFLPDTLKQEFAAHNTLLISLQKVHDEYPPIGWEQQLQRVANVYHLQYTPPEKP